MIVECAACSKEYLTEADPHGFVLGKTDGKLDWKHNCGCFWSAPLVAEISRLRRANEVLTKGLGFYGGSASETAWIDSDFEKGTNVEGIDDPYCQKVREDDMENMEGYHLGGKRARHALEQSKLIMEGKDA